MKKFFKNIISSICVVAMVLSMLVSAYATGTTVTIGSCSLEQGSGTESVEIPITISGNNGLCGFQVEVSYADGLVLENITNGNAFTLLSFTKAKDLTANPVTLPWDGESDEDNGNGVIATLTFSVSKETVAEYPISVTVTRAFDFDLVDIECSTVNGSITVTSSDSGSSGGETTDPTPDPEPEVTEPGEKVEDTLVNLYVVSENKAAGTVDVEGDYKTVDEVEIGTEITAVATPNAGYKFAYWRNYAGTVLSTEARETFKISTNTAIFAEFTKIPAEGEKVPVYFYNGNGLPHGKTEVDKGTVFSVAKNGIETPVLTGFKFMYWSMTSDESAIADNTPITETMHAVAIFGDTTSGYTVKVNGANYKTDAKYGEEVTVTSNDAGFKCWKLGEKVVSYDKSYKFSVWGDVSLTSENEGDEVPVAALDAAEGNPMLIYNVPENYEIVEAGILFGSTKEIHIGSVDGSKAIAKKGTGQFTAQPHEGAAEGTVSRGYLIYKTPEKEIRVIYAD